MLQDSFCHDAVFQELILSFPELFCLLLVILSVLVLFTHTQKVGGKKKYSDQAENPQKKVQSDGLID